MKRLQLWVITMFILTGIIGVFQLSEAPKSAGAVTVVGVTASATVAVPKPSVEATELPAWRPSAPASQSTGTSTAASQRPVVVARAATASATTQAAQVTAQATGKAPSTSTAVVSAKSVPATTQPKVTTTAPQATPTTARPATTSAKATTSAPQPSQSVLKPSASATPTTSATTPHCYRVVFFWVCR